VTTEQTPTLSAVTFTLTHGCSDGQQHDLYWQDDPLDRRIWLRCPRCETAVKMVYRWPDGRIEDPEHSPGGKMIFVGGKRR